MRRALFAITAVTITLALAGTPSSADHQADTDDVVCPATRCVGAADLAMGNFADLAEDPGFERSAATARAWTQAGAGGAFDFPTDATLARTGLRAARRQGNGTASNRQLINALLFEVRQGDTFLAEAHFRSDGADGTGQVALQWLDAALAQVAVSATNVQPTDGVYTRATGVFAAPAGAAFARVRLLVATHANGTWLADDVFVAKQTNAATLANNAVATAKIQNGAVTEAKLAFNPATQDELDTALANFLGTGDTTPNEATDLLGWGRLTGVPAGFADGTDDVDGGSAANVVCSGCIGTADIADGTVGSVDLAAGAVLSTHIAFQTITTDDLANNSVASSKIADASILGADIAAGTVTGINIADGSIPVGDLAFDPATQQEFDERTAYLATAQVDSRLDSVADLVGKPSIAIGADGRPIIAYKERSSGNLKIAKCVRVDCTGGATRTTITAASPSPSIAINVDGHPVVSFHTLGVGLRILHCGTLDCADATANTISTADNGTGVGTTSSIAIGGFGRPSVAYRDETNGLLKFVHCDDHLCSAPNPARVLDPNADIVFGVSMISGDVGPIVAYGRVSSDQLVIAHCTTFGCEAGSVVLRVAATDAEARDPSIAMGADALPIVAYKGSNGTLKVVRCSDDKCAGTSTPITLRGGGTGHRPSITIRRDGLPLILHGEFVSGVARYVVTRCRTFSCTSASHRFLQCCGLDGAVGIDADVAIGIDGQPAIALVDEENGARRLRVVHCHNPLCARDHYRSR